MLEFLLDLDISLFCLINGAHHPVGDTVFLIITQLGSGWTVTPILVGIVVWRVPRRRLVPVLAVATLAMTGSGLVNRAIKDAVRRPRPPKYFAEAGGGTPGVSSQTATACGKQLHVVGRKLKTRSFPSGHTNTAFSAAAVLAILPGGWFWTAFAPAAAVGYSRIYMGIHFPLDVLGGAILGVAMTSALMYGGLYVVARLSRSGSSQSDDTESAPAGGSRLK